MLDDSMLQSVVIDMFRVWKCGSIFLVADALDECPKRERAEIFPFFKMFRGLGLDLHLFLTSRWESDIRREMDSKGLCTQSLSLNHEAQHRTALNSYISMALSSSEYNKWKPHVKERVRQTLENKANGM